MSSHFIQNATTKLAKFLVFVSLLFFVAQQMHRKAAPMLRNCYQFCKIPYVLEDTKCLSRRISGEFPFIQPYKQPGWLQKGAQVSKFDNCKMRFRR